MKSLRLLSYRCDFDLELYILINQKVACGLSKFCNSDNKNLYQCGHRVQSAELVLTAVTLQAHQLHFRHRPGGSECLPNNCCAFRDVIFNIYLATKICCKLMNLFFTVTSKPSCRKYRLLTKFDDIQQTKRLWTAIQLLFEHCNGSKPIHRNV